MSLVEIADQGNTLETLKALRHKLAETIESSRSGRDISSLSRQLQIVVGQIEALENNEENRSPTVLDVILAKHRKAAQEIEDEG